MLRKNFPGRINIYTGIGSFNLEISYSQVDVYLDCMPVGGNNCQLYLCNNSVTMFPTWYLVGSCKMSMPFSSKSLRFLCIHFVWKLDNNLLSCLFHTKFCLPWWFLGDHKRKYFLLELELYLSKFFWDVVLI